MGATQGQLRLMGLQAWFVTPSTGRNAFGAPPASTGGIPPAGRRRGPYPARLSHNRSIHRGSENEMSALGGQLVVASTVPPSTMMSSVVISPTTVAEAGHAEGVQAVHVYYDRIGPHHVTLTLGSAP